MNQPVGFCPNPLKFVAITALCLALLTELASFMPPSAHATNASPKKSSTVAKSSSVPILNPPPSPVPVEVISRPLKSMTPLPPPSNAKDDDVIVLQTSKPITASAAQWQKWDDYITIKTGQEHIPLTLSFQNGTNGLMQFQDVRINLAGRPLASLKDFKGLSSLSLNLTDAVGVGDSLISIQAYGQPGARFSWKLATAKPSVTGVTPISFGLNEKVAVDGKNFAERATSNSVTIGGKAVTVTTAKKNKLELSLPKDLPGGKQDLVVTVGLFRCNPIKVTIKAAPEVSSVNFISTCPGQPIVVFGKGFSEKSSENEVFVGGVSAPISSCTTSSISCTVPDLPFPQWYVPITVKTSGTASKGTVTINLQQRVIPNDGTPEQ